MRKEQENRWCISTEFRFPCLCNFYLFSIQLVRVVVFILFVMVGFVSRWTYWNLESCATWYSFFSWRSVLSRVECKYWNLAFVRRPRRPSEWVNLSKTSKNKKLKVRFRLRLRQSWKGKPENENIFQRSFNSKPWKNLEDFKMGNCIQSFMSERSRLSRVPCKYFVHIVQCDFDNFHSLFRVGKWIFHKKTLKKEKLQVWIGCRYESWRTRQENE